MVTKEDANDIIERIVALHDAFENIGAFYFLIKEINTLAESQSISGKHADVLNIVRAAALRSTFSGVMACLDTRDRRGNRAGIGEIIKQLKKPDLGKIFQTHNYTQSNFESDVAALEKQFNELTLSSPYKNTKELRDRDIAHILIIDSSAKTLAYSELHNLFSDIEVYIDTLYKISGLGKSKFRDRYNDHKSNAELFVSTYTGGMRML